MVNLFTNNDNNKEKKEKNNFEIGTNPEQKEQFDKNAKDFQEKYSQKLKNILPEEIFKKLSGNFELNGNIDKTIDSLKDSGLSEKSVDLIKSNLKQNIDISKENLQEINKEIKEFSEKKDLDIKLGDLIGKVSKMAENTENDDLFDSATQAREIQKNGSPEEKTGMITKLESLISNKNSQNLTNGENIVTEEKNIQEKPEKTETVEQSLQYDGEDKYEESLLFGNQFAEKEDILEQNNGAEKLDFSEANGEYFPILKNLNDNGDISKENFDKVNQDLASLSGQEKTDKFVNSIDKIVQNKEVKNGILEKFKNSEPVNSENFDKTPFSAAANGKLDIDKSVGGLETMLAENYIYLPNKENGQEKNTEKSLEMTLEVATNKIVKNKTEEFKNNNSELISDIKKENNLDAKYKLLKKLYEASLLEDAKYGGKKGAEEMNQKKDSLKQRYQEMLLEKQKADKNPNEVEKQKKLQELQKIEQEIIQEAKNVENFEKELEKIEANVSSLSGGKTDYSPENSINKEPNQTTKKD
ncbi:hypothetical protein D8B46_08310 [Candidatus Gracilibacteria bacterium]|nr:MAG: hypothetical protein D8B46_08310 [Candidatus Gracilibacteria bacterium]